MNLEKFTDRAKGFLQSAQTVAIRMSHQRIGPEHLLKALLEDEQGMDEKILCVFENDYARINDLASLSNEIKISIYDFFTKYKNNTNGRWSKVYGYEDKKSAIKVYQDCLISN